MWIRPKTSRLGSRSALELSTAASVAVGDAVAVDRLRRPQPARQPEGLRCLLARVELACRVCLSYRPPSSKSSNTISVDREGREGGGRSSTCAEVEFRSENLHSSFTLAAAGRIPGLVTSGEFVDWLVIGRFKGGSLEANSSKTDRVLGRGTEVWWRSDLSAACGE
ncbi:hypothetical protein R1flu_024618 [Riccia fluitans]|uniref:Uncharacterized protein n=1 Tax=Riccia fluitans TaxID=41844 RepID=A0ABD1XYG3_9MARC